MTQHAASFDPPAEPFVDLGQQRQAATLGMWAFLAQEVLFFGTLFVAFFVCRHQYKDSFVQGANELIWWMGAINTAVLLVSSFAVAQGVLAARQGNQRSVIRWFLIAFALGIVFVGVKAAEYVIDYHEGLVPVLNYTSLSPAGTERPGQMKLFMCFYFIGTALHALHVIVGLCLLAFVAVTSVFKRFRRGDSNFVDGVGLYWHFVDLVWVFLYPTLYLLRHP